MCLSALDHIIFTPPCSMSIMKLSLCESSARRSSRPASRLDYPRHGTQTQFATVRTCMHAGAAPGVPKPIRSSSFPLCWPFRDCSHWQSRFRALALHACSRICALRCCKRTYRRQSIVCMGDACIGQNLLNLRQAIISPRSRRLLAFHLCMPFRLNWHVAPTYIGTPK